MARRFDIDRILKEWPYQPGEISARLVRAADGREVLQMRIEMGVLQLETSGRPDGENPGGHGTYFEHLKQLAGEDGEGLLVLTNEQFAEAAREFVQY